MCPPFQGWDMGAFCVPGRCPGLLCPCLSGRRNDRHLVTHGTSIDPRFLSPRGWHITAQGNALGTWPAKTGQALKGRNTDRGYAGYAPEVV